MKKTGNITLLLFLCYFNSFTQQKNNNVSILKSTITTVGSSSVLVSNNYIAQSIGQTGIIGKKDFQNTSMQQGFLTNVISFTINNENPDSFNKTLQLNIYPNPFVEYINLNYAIGFMKFAIPRYSD